MIFQRYHLEFVELATFREYPHLPFANWKLAKQKANYYYQFFKKTKWNFSCNFSTGFVKFLQIRSCASLVSLSKSSHLDTEKAGAVACGNVRQRQRESCIKVIRQSQKLNLLNSPLLVRSDEENKNTGQYDDDDEENVPPNDENKSSEDERPAQRAPKSMWSWLFHYLVYCFMYSDGNFQIKKNAKRKA